MFSVYKTKNHVKDKMRRFLNHLILNDSSNRWLRLFCRLILVGFSLFKEKFGWATYETGWHQYFITLVEFFFISLNFKNKRKVNEGASGLFNPRVFNHFWTCSTIIEFSADIFRVLYINLELNELSPFEWLEFFVWNSIVRQRYTWLVVFPSGLLLAI